MRLAAAVLLLAVLGVAACGDEGPASASVPEWAKVAPEQLAEAQKHGVPVAFENHLGMRFVLIPAGTFLMGSPEEEEGRDEDEIQHEVTLSKAFYMQITEVTNGQYGRWRPLHDSGDHAGRSLDAGEQPVVAVSWQDAVDFSIWLSHRDSTRAYKLPTEAEWECACRARTAGRFWWGESEADAGRYANVSDRTAVRDLDDDRDAFDTDDGHPVSAPAGTYLPNPWGLHDMLGNVWEWCADWYGDYSQGQSVDPQGPAEAGARIEEFAWEDLAGEVHDYKGPLRIARGGSWTTDRRWLRAAHRDTNDPVVLLD